MTRDEKYEMEKKKLQAQSLRPEQYEAAIRALCKRMGH